MDDTPMKLHIQKENMTIIRDMGMERVTLLTISGSVSHSHMILC